MDNTWEKLYSQQGENAMMQFPFPIVIELLNFYNNQYREKSNNDIKVLEVGCGSGANLKYAASLGFDVYGIDISETAIQYTKESFKKNNLHGTFLTADASSLPFDSNFFDIVIDRGGLVCLTEEKYIMAINEVHRVSKTRSISLLSLYSENNYNTISLSYANNYRYKGSFRNNDIYVNNINLQQLIKVLNNRFKVVKLRRNDTVNYKISEDHNSIQNSNIHSMYSLFIEKI